MPKAGIGDSCPKGYYNIISVNELSLSISPDNLNADVVLILITTVIDRLIIDLVDATNFNSKLLHHFR